MFWDIKHIKLQLAQIGVHFNTENTELVSTTAVGLNNQN